MGPEYVRELLERGVGVEEIRRMLEVYDVEDPGGVIEQALDPDHGTEADGPLPDGRKMVRAWGSTRDLPGISGGSWECEIGIRGDVSWSTTNLAPHIGFPRYGTERFDDEREALAFWRQRRVTLAKALEEHSREAINSLGWGAGYTDRRDALLERVAEMSDRGARVLSYGGEDLGPFEPEEGQ